MRHKYNNTENIKRQSIIYRLSFLLPKNKKGDVKMVNHIYIYHISKGVDVLDSRPEAVFTHTANEILQERVEREKRLSAIKAKRKYSLLSRIASIFI